MRGISPHVAMTGQKLINNTVAYLLLTLVVNAVAYPLRRDRRDRRDHQPSIRALPQARLEGRCYSCCQ